MNFMSEKSEQCYGENDLNESLRRMITINNPDKAIQDLLMFLGERCRCERTYIFEKEDSRTFSNTYEWCAPNITPQKDLLQKEPVEMIQWWWDLFETDQPVIIRNLEEIKETYPQVYAVLKPQEIDSLITTAIRLKGELIGFIGVDNPEEDKIDAMVPFLSGISYFVSFVLERRNLTQKLEYLSYHDQLTGAYNRHAYSEFIQDFHGGGFVGAVYGDISGMKQINDSGGHQQGDRLICFWYKALQEIFPKDRVYRIGGDEFIVISTSGGKKEFHMSISKLEETVFSSEHHLAVGSAWCEGAEVDLDELLSRAEKNMYKDKSLYYSQTNPLTGKIRDRRRQQQELQYDNEYMEENEELAKFLQNNIFDPVVFFRSISMSDYYPFVGDLRSNLFYVSDEMRDIFGFQSNIISDLIGAWEKRITDPKDLELFRADMERILRGETEVHNLYYRVKDRSGENIWVHSHGIVKWNKERTEPIFFSGGCLRQEKNFVIDSVTNFPKEYTAMQKLRELQEQQEMITAIGFTLNNFSEINELRGRHAANLFLNKVAKKLAYNFDNRLLLCRLDGLRFLAIVLPGCTESAQELIRQIRELISGVYYGNNVVVQVPASFGVIYEEGDGSLPQDILVNMMGLLTQAKQMPEKEYLIYSPQEIHSQKSRAQLTMELNRNVIDGFKNFRIVVQPVVSTRTMTVTSGEVLLRWQFEGKDVSSAVFIPMLENSRLILNVGKWVLEQAIRTCSRALAYLPEFRLAVNTSYYQIMDPDFLPFLEKTLKKYDVEGNRLVLEMTETHYDEAPIKVRQFVENCKKLGIEVAIDDFGDGYSSLAFLIKYPAGIVKLDRSLINEMGSSEDNINFITSIVYACHKFGKKVCAEGVETQEEFEIIRDSGCDMIQGYYFYKPLELPDFYRVLPENLE